jgi:uncharacterized OB-fold protein
VLATRCLDCLYYFPTAEICPACGSKCVEPVDLDEKEGDEE